MESRSRRRRLGRAALAIAGTLTALLLAEGLYRLLFAGDNGPTTNPRYVVHDDLLGWRYRPGAVARHATASFDVTIRIDARGFRCGADTEAAEPVPAADIVCIGDSLTFGWGVEERESFAARLRERTGMPVLNLGVSGYGTDQQWLLLREHLAAHRPRVVIVVFCVNDVEEVTHTFVYGKSKPRFAFDADGALRLENVPVPFGPLARRSQLFRTLRRHLVEWRRPPPTPEQTAAGRRLVLALYHAMAEAVRRSGGTLVVCTTGQAWLEDSPSIPGLARLDLAPALREASRSAPTVLAGDGHWNVRGHEVVAEALHRFLVGENLLGPAARPGGR